MAEQKQQRPIKDPAKCYDAEDNELRPGDKVTLTGVWLDMAKTDAGADCRVRLMPTPTGFCPIIAVHASQLLKQGE